MNDKFNTLSIDKSSPIPIYHQIAVSLINRIKMSEWEALGKLPSESDLSSEYDVSRITIRQALAELEKDGIITKHRGKGAFINVNPTPFVHDLSFPSILGARLGEKGIDLKAKVLTCHIVAKPIPGVNDHLNLLPHEDIIYLKRLFLLDNKPIGLNRSWFPLKLVPDLVEQGLIDNSITKTLSLRYGYAPIRIENSIEAVRSSVSDSNLLQTSYDTPVMVVNSISYLADNTSLEYSSTSWIGDIIKFHFSITKTSDGLMLTP